MMIQKEVPFHGVRKHAFFMIKTEKVHLLFFILDQKKNKSPTFLSFLFVYKNKSIALLARTHKSSVPMLA